MGRKSKSCQGRHLKGKQIMKKIISNDVKQPVFKTGMPEIGDIFSFDDEVFMRISDLAKPSMFSHQDILGFCAVHLLTGDISMFSGDQPDSYFILDSTITCNKIIISE